MKAYCTPEHNRDALKRLKQASDSAAFSMASMAWESQLRMEEQDASLTPTLPAVLAEEAGLVEEIQARAADLEELRLALAEGQSQLPCVQAEVAQEEAAARDIRSPWSIFNSPEEQASIDALRQRESLVLGKLDQLLERITALELTLESLRRRQAMMPSLAAAATEQLGDIASIAVAARDQREWTYEYAANMAEVGPNDPDSMLQDRMDARESAGKFDCDTFVVHVLEEAGYDLDAVITVEGQETTVRRFVMIHAETIMRDEFQIPAGSQDSPLSKSDRLAVLKGLLDSGDERMGGVATALVASGQGHSITNKNELRPGDLLQYWYKRGRDGAAGHAVVVHKVRTRGGILDEKSSPTAEPMSVRGVGLLSAHYKAPNKSDVFTKGFVDPDREYLKWFAVRPSGSKWPMVQK